jgi:hypothetical protein
VPARRDDYQQPAVEELTQVLAHRGCTHSCYLRQLAGGERPPVHQRVDHR